MLPIYISYFAGGEEGDVAKTVKNALGFVLGFTAVFVLLGALSGSLGMLLLRYKRIVDIVTGLAVIFFGLNFIGVFKINIFKGSSLSKPKSVGFFSSVLFGIVFSIGWTPCVGAFLGSALLLAASEGGAIKGIVMLLLYSLGLGIPFFISAVLIGKLKGAFTFIKKHYNIVNTACGILLVAVGLLMATGLMNKLLVFLS